MVLTYCGLRLDKRQLLEDLRLREEKRSVSVGDYPVVFCGIRRVGGGGAGERVGRGNE